MPSITLDSELRARLGAFDRVLALCDEEGQTVAHVVPAATFEKLVYAWARSQVSDADSAQARGEPGGMTTTDAIAFLEKLVRPPRKDS
jgi:hypothetical protein